MCNLASIVLDNTNSIGIMGHIHPNPNACSAHFFLLWPGFLENKPAIRSFGQRFHFSAFCLPDSLGAGKEKEAITLFLNLLCPEEVSVDSGTLRARVSKYEGHSQSKARPTCGGINILERFKDASSAMRNTTNRELRGPRLFSRVTVTLSGLQN